MAQCKDLHDPSQFRKGVTKSDFGPNSYHLFKFWYQSVFGGVGTKT